MSNFRMLTTKNTLNSAFLMPPTLTGGELTKSGGETASDYSKKFHDTTKKCQIGAFFCQKIANFQGQKRH